MMINKLAIGLLSAFLPAIMLAEGTAVNRYVLRVDGLNCMFCAYTVEKLVGKVPGVDKESFDMDLKKGLVMVASQAERYVSPSALKGAVNDSGFSYRSMEIHLTGAWAKANGEQVFRPVGSQDTFRISQVASGSITSPAGQEIHARIKEMPPSKDNVELLEEIKR